MSVMELENLAPVARGPSIGQSTHNKASEASGVTDPQEIQGMGNGGKGDGEGEMFQEPPRSPSK